MNTVLIRLEQIVYNVSMSLRYTILSVTAGEAGENLGEDMTPWHVGSLNGSDLVTRQSSSFFKLQHVETGQLKPGREMTLCSTLMRFDVPVSPVYLILV